MLKLISTGIGNPPIYPEKFLESEFKRLLKSQPDNQYLCLIPDNAYRLIQQDLGQHNGRYFVSKVDYDDMIELHYVVLGGMAVYVNELEECYIVETVS